jgi:long-chain fatty acid transport protein
LNRRALVVGLLAVDAAAASPAHSAGFDSRGSALGGAVSADVQDASAVFYNPSGLCLGLGNELSFGYSALSYALEIDGRSSGLEAVQSLQAGVVTRGAVARLPFAFGLALDLPNGRLSKLTSVRESEPYWPLYQASSEIVDLGAMVALRPFEFLSVGGGVGFLAATRGGFHVTGTARLADGAGSEYDSRLRHEVHSDLASVRYPVFGLTVVPAERLRFGLAFRDSAQLEQRVSGTLEGEVDATFTRVPVRYRFESTTVSGFLPRQVTLGGSLRPLRELTLNLDLVWQGWSEYPSPVGSSSTTLDAGIPPGLPVDLPEDSPATRPAPPGFEDRIVPRVGLESSLATTPKFKLLLRAGYAFERSPAPRRLVALLIDADRHLFSFGTGFVWTRPASWLPSTLELDTHALFTSLIERRLTAAAGGVSRDLSAAGTTWSAGATLGLGFE